MDGIGALSAGILNCSYVVKQEQGRRSRAQSRKGETDARTVEGGLVVEARKTEDQGTEKAKVGEGRAEGYLDRYRRNMEEGLICGHECRGGRKPDVRVLYRMCRAARYWSVQIGAIERFYSVVLGAGKHVLAVVRGRYWTLTGLR